MSQIRTNPAVALARAAASAVTIQREIDNLTHANVDKIRALLLRGRRSVQEVRDLRQLLSKQMRRADRKILYALTRHQFDDEVAAYLLTEIVRHMEELERQVGRPVSIKVAALDYFENVEEISDRLELIHEDQLRQLVRFALVDELTGAFTRDFFEYRFQEEADRARRYKKPLSLLLLDIDHFKSYNDAFGHPAGDEVLRILGRAIDAAKRDSDLFFRYGGEEFALLLPETTAHDAVALGQRILEDVPARTRTDPRARRAVTVSVGVGELTEQDATPADVLRAADDNLYRAKREGRNRLVAGDGADQTRAGEPAAATGGREIMEEADRLWASRGEVDRAGRAKKLLEEALARGEDFEVRWRLARLAWWEAEGATDNAARVAAARSGMEHARKALALQPARVEGHFWLVATQGEYSLGISILKALAEGLEGEFRRHGEEAYRLDRTYEGGGPARALGRFWYKLPWPKRNLKKSALLLREAVEINSRRLMNHLFLGETLVSLGDKAEARKELEWVLAAQDTDPAEAPDAARYRKAAEAALAEL